MDRKMAAEDLKALRVCEIIQVKFRLKFYVIFMVILCVLTIVLKMIVYGLGIISYFMYYCHVNLLLFKKNFANWTIWIYYNYFGNRLAVL